MKKNKTQTAQRARLPQQRLVRKSDVVRLLNEYIKSHAQDNASKTLVRAIRHDVMHDLPNDERIRADQKS